MDFIIYGMKKILLLLYYGFLQYIPMQPMPGYKIGYKLRLAICKFLLKKCGQNVIIKNKCYFGNGNRLSVGNRSQLGQNSRLNGTINIGDDVVMGPDVVMMATSHEFKSIDIPINLQASKEEQPIVIGNDCWIGTRVIILPGCHIGDHCIIGAGAVVTKSFPSNCIIARVPAKCIKYRTND